MVFALEVRAVRSRISPATMSFAQILYLATRKLSRRTVCAFCLSKHMSCCVLARSLLFRLIIINCEIFSPLRLLKRFTFFQHIFYVLALFGTTPFRHCLLRWADIRNCLQFCTTNRRQRQWESKYQRHRSRVREGGRIQEQECEIFAMNNLSKSVASFNCCLIYCVKMTVGQ